MSGRRNRQNTKYQIQPTRDRNNNERFQRRRYETEPIQYSGSHNSRPHKMIQSSIFLPLIKNKDYSSPGNVLNKKYSNQNTITDSLQNSDIEAYQCLNQCQKIIQKLKKLTKSSHNRMKNHRRSFSLYNQQERQDSRKYNKNIPKQSSAMKQILHIRTPESPKKYQHKKAKQKYEKFLDHQQFRISPFTPKNNNQFDTDPQKSQRRYNKSSRCHESSQENSGRINSIENSEKQNERNIIQGHQQMSNSIYRKRMKSLPNQTIESGKITIDNKIMGSRKHQSNKNQFGFEDELEDKIKNNQLKQQNSEQEKIASENKQNHTFAIKKRQKTLLKYLTKAKNRGSTLNSKLKEHQIRKYHNGSKGKAELNIRQNVGSSILSNNNQKTDNQLQNEETRKDQASNPI